MTERQTLKRVRTAVFHHYDYWHYFNDIRSNKRTRRLKFMKNGVIFAPERYKSMAARIKTELSLEGIKVIDAGFKSGYGAFGEYVYFYVVLPVKR